MIDGPTIRRPRGAGGRNYNVILRQIFPRLPGADLAQDGTPPAETGLFPARFAPQPQPHRQGDDREQDVHQPPIQRRGHALDTPQADEPVV